MSDYKLPELPSDEDLGIDEKDLEQYAEKSERELSPSELLAFLDDEPGTRDPGKAKAQRDEPARAQPKTSEPPRSRWKGPATLLVLAASTLAFSTLTGLPDPVPVNAPATEFSSGRAMAHVLDIARRPHPTGSPEHAAVLAYLLDRLGGMGLEAEVQNATVVRGTGTSVRAVTVRNVVARMPGTDPTGTLLVTAHYDGRVLSRAAGDDASGVATILEAVRALRERGAVQNDLIVLFTDAEELGLMGARAFMEQHPLASDVDFVVSMEMRGTSGPVHMFETGAENGWAVRAFQRAAPSPLANSVSREIYRRMPNDTDFTVFREAGVQGLNFAAIGGGAAYHQPFDAPERLSESTLQHEGGQLLGLLLHLGQEDLAAVDAPDVVYFTLPFVGLVAYPSVWVLPVSLLVLLAYAGALVLARRTGVRPGGVGVGAGVSLLAMALAYGAGLWLVGWVPRFHAEAGSLEGAWLYREGWYVLALVAATFTVVVGLHGLSRRWLSARELVLGAAAVPVLGATIASIVAPMGAMNLHWPALACVVGALAVSSRARGAAAWAGWAVALVLAAIALGFLVQIVEGVWMAMTLSAAPILAVLLVVTLYLMLPALDAVREPNAWWGPFLGLLATVGFFSLGMLSARPSPERPLFSTLIYTYDHDTDEAVWVTDPVQQAADTAARAWAEAATGVEFAQRQPMSDFIRDTAPVAVARAEAADVPLPEIVTLSDTATEASRRLRIGLRSGVGAELVQLRFPEGGGTRAVSINGVRLDPAGPPVLEHWGQPDSMIVVELETTPGAEPGFHVVEHLLRPEVLVGPSAFARPPELVPHASRQSDRAILRSAWGSLSFAAAGGVPGAAGAVAPAADSAAASGTSSR